MKVKDVIISALNIIGRSELSAELSAGNSPEGEGAETVNTLLYCFNATEDELARKYIPLVFKEELLSPDGEFYYLAFTHTPVKIKSVVSDGREIDYEPLTRFLKADAKKITVEYEYAPALKKMDGTSDYGEEVGEYLIAAGAVAEYYLINGEAEASKLWEEKYRSSIDRAQSKLPVCKNIPPRRWI